MILILSSLWQTILLQVKFADICVSGVWNCFPLIAGSDYGQIGVSSPLSTSVTIPSGGLFVSYSVDIIDDTVQEENETFSLTVDLQPSCLPVNINGDQSFTITIIDDEGNDISVCCMCYYVGLL